MSHFKKILVFIKKSKLNYLTQKYGEAVKSSSEYNLLKESMTIHYKNCDNFLKQLEKSLSKEQKFDVFFDDFEKYSNYEDFAEAKKNNYDLIFSLGGDGTFLRSLNFNDSNDQLVVGLNTDGKYSTGFYCSLNSMDEKIEEKIHNVFQNKFKHKFLNKLKVRIVSENADYFINSTSQAKNEDDKEIRDIDELYMDDTRNVISNKIRSYNFINDLYYGEKFMGRISKCQLELENEQKCHTLKSSGLIVSTFLGYSGWIKNANTISFSKFENLFKYNPKNTFNDSDILQLYNNKVYVPNYDNENSIFYFVREPAIKKISNFSSEQDYLEYLKFMEGSAKSLKIRNFCYEGILILDGTFTVPVTYNDLITISVGENKVRTLAL